MGSDIEMVEVHDDDVVRVRIISSFYTKMLTVVIYGHPDMPMLSTLFNLISEISGWLDDPNRWAYIQRCL